MDLKTADFAVAAAHGDGRDTDQAVRSFPRGFADAPRCGHGIGAAVHPFAGLGSMVSQVVGAECPRKVVPMSLPDAPVITGTSKEVFDYYGLNAEGIAKKAKELLA